MCTKKYIITTDFPMCSLIQLNRKDVSIWQNKIVKQ